MSLLPLSIPSPTSGTLEIGSLRLTAYGLMIALGVLASVAIVGRRLEKSGAGTRDEMGTIAVWGVLVGVVGARLYHVATDWSDFAGDLGRIPLIWKGGLGIPGGLIGGVAGGLFAARRRGVQVPYVLTAAAPAIPIGQAIGRCGNYWNQELFGSPTTLPWALQISDDKIPEGYALGTTFHPTFLYESLWSVGLCLVLLWVDKHVRLRPGRLFAVYLAGYFAGRFWIEGLRIDRAHVIGGLRLNQWVAVVVIVSAVVYLLVNRSRGQRDPEPSLVMATATSGRPIEASDPDV